MKAFLLLSFLICSCSFSQAQTYNSSCTPSGTMETTYRNDACRLAIKRLHETASPFADSIIIPEVLIDSIERALYAVDNIQNALVDDTLRGIFGHTNFLPGSDSTHIVSAGTGGAYGLKTVMVIVNNNTPWGAEWLSGNYNATSNDSVNYLVNNNHLQVALNIYQLYTDSTIYIVSAPLAINAGALASQFEDISGVGNADITGSSFGDGNFIEAVFTASHIKLTYSYGCGDCPLGCTIRRNWTFNVYTDVDCSVEYVAVENWGFPLQWATAPCIDNVISTPLCASGSSTIHLYTYALSDTLQWQVSTDGINYNNISDDGNYTGTNTGTLQLHNIPSSWYGNTYTCLTNGNRGKVFFTIKFSNTWISTSDPAWENTANWSCGALPDSNTDVVIRTGTVFLNSDVTVRTLTVAAGASLTIAPGKHLTVLH